MKDCICIFRAPSAAADREGEEEEERTMNPNFESIGKVRHGKEVVFLTTTWKGENTHTNTMEKNVWIVMELRSRGEEEGRS